MNQIVNVLPYGPSGISAYQVALKNGFVGTEAAWLASLVGPDGPPNILEIGDVTELEPGATPTAAIIGDTPNQTLNLGLPSGARWILPRVFGAHPAASAAVNVAAIQTALDRARDNGGGTVMIDVPGAYAVNATMWIYSDTTLVCAPGVVLSKSGSNFGEVLANDGARTGVTDSNLHLYGVVIQCNGNQLIEAITSGLRGQISLYRVTDFSVKGVRMLDLPNSQFGLHICSWENMLVEDAEFSGTKDGLHLGTGGITGTGLVRSLRGDTTDDLLAINAHDWTVSNPTTGPIKNLTVEQMVSHSTTRIMTGSWAAWSNGYTYQAGDRVLSNGKLYTCGLAAGGSAVASVAPSHTSGFVTGADSIPWRYERTTSDTTTDVSNIVFRDCHLLFAGILRDGNNDAAGYYRAVTPGTEGNAKIEGIVFDGGSFNPSQAGQVLLGGQGRFTEVSLRDLRLQGANIAAVVAHNAFTVPASYASAHTARMNFSGCSLDVSGSTLSMVSGTQGNLSLTISGEGNRMGTITYVSGVVQSVDGFDLPYREDHILAPVLGDRTRLRLTDTTIPTKRHVRRADRWTPEANDLYRGMVSGAMHDTAAAGRSFGLCVIGDSTGNESGEWVQKFAASLAADFPTHMVLVDTYTGPGWTRTTIQNPGNGDRYWANPTSGFSGCTYDSREVQRTPNADFVIEIKLEAASWAAIENGTRIVQQFGLAGNRAFRVSLNPNGVWIEWVEQDGVTARSNAASVTKPGFADGAAGWIRVYIDVDNGAGQYEIKYYKSTDGITWTQLGSTAVGATGPTSVFAGATAPLEFLGAGNVNTKVYEIRMRESLTGPTINNLAIDAAHFGSTSSTVALGGDPVILISNMSVPGAGTAYFTQTEINLIPNYNTLGAMIALGHNDTGLTGAQGLGFLAGISSIWDKIKLRCPFAGLVAMSQNAENYTDAKINAGHAIKMAQLSAWARRNGHGFVDVYRAFLDDPRGLSALVESNGVHPITAGNVLWGQVVTNSFREGGF